MDSSILQSLRVSPGIVNELNRFLLDPENPMIASFLSVIEKYGGVQEINRKACESGKPETLIRRLSELNSPYVRDLQWLQNQKDKRAFISVEEYRKRILGDRYGHIKFKDNYAVTLELSAAQYFPWLMVAARQAVERGELMPGRYIRVRNMAEQVRDNDILAFTAATKIIGSSCCETLDTKGTDGSNVHLGGPETITGYFGGVGQPNDHALAWLDEFLHYYTEYGVRQVLNINPGTVLLGYLLHKIGVDIEFKISVFMGNDNPYSVLWTLMTAKLFSRPDGTTSLIGFNFSNSVDNGTIELSDGIRNAFGFEDVVRFEHHILETYRAIVRQPYDRRDELIEITPRVKNISAKHEGGEVLVEESRERPSSILDYFLTKEDIEEQGVAASMERNFLDKHDAVNNTAKALTENGLSFIAARELHH